MHEPMYDHPGVLEAIETVGSWGVTFIDPRVEEGRAKIAAEETIVLETARATGERPLSGRTVVVTSGATSEAIDPVRVITNRASGRTGRAVARGCYTLGADVVLVHDGAAVPYATVEQVTSAAEMLEAVLDHAPKADAVVSAAAISDYTVETAETKLRSGEDRTLDLRSTPKLIDTVREQHPDLPIVGFKLESEVGDEQLVEKARETLERAQLAFVVANDTAVLGESETRVLVVHADEVKEFAGSKATLGRLIGETLATEFDGDPA